MKFKKKISNSAIYCGVLGVAVLWAGLSLSVVRTQLDIFGVQPLSSLGVNKASEGLFSTSLVLSAMLFICYGWFLYSKFSPWKAFIIVFIISHIGELVTGLVQYGGRQKIVHTVAAFGWALTIPVAMYFFQKSLKHNLLLRPAKYFLWAQMVATIIGIAAFIALGKALPLCQLFIALPFHAWVIYTTVFIVRYKNESLHRL